MNSDLSIADAFLVLNGLPGLGPVTMRRLMERFEDPRRILEASKKELMWVKDVGEVIASTLTHWSEHMDVEREREKLQRFGARFIHAEEPDYPALLKEIYDPPIGLYWKGNYEWVDRPAIAIVGSRRSTLYGLRVARQLGSSLARLGFCVVSGMARGIDSAAHEGALESGGPTLALFGCGIDVIYPPENQELYQSIQEHGAVVSEFPLGRKANRSTFPMRNRIIAGMCQAVIVVETDERGGSMITARFAADQNRSVFAVPGRIDQPSSRGCHKLIREGATLLTEVDQLVEELNFRGQAELDFDTGNKGRSDAVSSEKAEERVSLSPSEKRVFECFDGGSILSLDTVIETTAMAPHEVASILMMLELKKLVAKHADGCFEAR